MKRKSPIIHSQRKEKPKLDSYMFYTVLFLSALAAIAAYSAGASLEAAFLRAVIVLLVSTILGFALNIWMALSAHPLRTIVVDGRRHADTAGTSASPAASSEQRQIAVLADSELPTETSLSLAPESA